MALALSLVAAFALAALVSGFVMTLAASVCESSRFSTTSGAAWLMAPVITAAGICCALLGPSLIQGACHCVAHGLHHPHLCLRHPEFAAAMQLPAAVFLTTWAWLALPQLWRLLGDFWQTVLWVRQVSRAAEQTLDGVPFRLIDAPGLGACTTGLLVPIIAVDSGLWLALNDEEQRAVLHHEDAHRKRLDPLTLFFLEICAAVVVVRRPIQILRRWQGLAEKECDLHAAQTVHSPEGVASALLTLARYHRERPRYELSLSFHARGGVLEERVRTLLGPGLREEPAALGNDVLAVSRTGFALLLAFALLTGDLAHHGAETALGFLIGHHH